MPASALPRCRAHTDAGWGPQVLALAPAGATVVHSRVQTRRFCAANGPHPRTEDPMPRTWILSLPKILVSPRPSPKPSCPRRGCEGGGAHGQACREPPWREKTPASPGACVLSTLERRSVHDALSERAGHLPLSARAAVRPAGACLAWRSPPWPGWRGSHSLCPSLAVQPQPGDLRDLSRSRS